MGGSAKAVPPSCAVRRTRRDHIMAITFNGLSTGLDTEKIVTDLVRFSQKRIDALKSRERVETSRQTALKGIETRIQTLQTQVAKLGRPQGSVFDRKTVSSSASTKKSKSSHQLGPCRLRCRPRRPRLCSPLARRRGPDTASSAHALTPRQGARSQLNVTHR